MSKLPSMPFFVDAYLADTRKLSLAQRGAYTDILCFMWANGGQMLDDEAEICRMLGVSKKVWLPVRERLLDGFIHRVGNDTAGHFLVQKRLQLEWNYVREFHLRQSAKGERSQQVQRERKQILGGNSGSSPVQTKRSTETDSGSNRNVNRNSAPIPNKDIITSLQDAEAQKGDEEKFPNHLLETQWMRRAL